MKRSLLVAVVAGSFALAGCEDGPNQTFNPSPAGAGSNWNNGNTVGNANSATQSFAGATSTGTNLNEICDAQKKHTVWANMVKQPVHPPSVGGGIDIAGGPLGDGVPDPKNDLANEAWTGLTLDAAEKINCQSTFQYDVYGDGDVYNAYWGDNAEVSVNYLVSTRQLLTVVMDQGYLGTMEVDTADKAHHYSVGVGVPISMDKAPLELDWNNQTDFKTKVNQMYGAVASTYSAFAPEPDCFATGHCISKQLTDVYAYIWFTTVGFTMIFQNPYMSPTLGATPIEFDQDKTKVLGFTSAAVLMQNDLAGVGPTGVAKNVFGSGKDCNFTIGMKFGDFTNNCVAPFTDQTKAKTEMTKLFSGISHGAETYGFDVVGFDPNFLATTLADTAVIQDTDRPQPNDTAFDMDVDQNTVGSFMNDFTNNDPTLAQDWHGIGMTTLEWAILLESAINQEMTTADPKHPEFTHHIGDVACLTAHPAAGCTGLEGIVTTAPRNFRGQANDINALGSAPLQCGATAAAMKDDPCVTNPNDLVGEPQEFGGISPGLKPTTWQSFFCNDGAGMSGGALSGYTPQNCTTSDNTVDLSYFKNAMAQVQRVAGQAGVLKLPSDLTDVRFYFKNWIFAFVKYLGVANNPAVSQLVLDAVPVDQNNLFFDSIGSGQFEFAEYIDRHNVTATTAPLDIRITADILHAIMNDFLFSRALLRGETALYTAMNGGSTAPIGKTNNVFLSNVFGAPAIASLYPSFACATNDGSDPVVDGKCNGLRAPSATGVAIKNDDGSLLLSPYEGAFEGTPFTVATATPITPLQVMNQIEAVYVEVPVYKNPYDQTSTLLTPVRKLIPWLPQGADVGFPIAINGQQDKFIETYQMDFSGITISANVDYVFEKQGQANLVKVDAVETTDFLGEIFMCSDPASLPSGDDDLLHVRMYSSAATITQWFAGHPGTDTSCGMIYQYSLFGNYLDEITSTVNGIRLEINPGGGQGRVVGVTLYDPSITGQ